MNANGQTREQALSTSGASGADRRMHWVLGALLLGLLNTFAVATYGALGVSRNYIVVDNLISRAAGSTLQSTNVYLSRYPAEVDWLLMIGAGMVIGGFLAALLRGGLNRRAVPRLWRSRFGPSRLKRFSAAFAGGFLLLFGARIAGGCTSGLVLSGMAQLAPAGFVFAVSIMASGIITAKLLYRRTP